MKKVGRMAMVRVKRTRCHFAHWGETVRTDNYLMSCINGYNSGGNAQRSPKNRLLLQGACREDAAAAEMARDCCCTTDDPPTRTHIGGFVTFCTIMLVV
jgi:hypothetical protein